VTVEVLCREGCRRVPLRVVRNAALLALRWAGRPAGRACILLTRDGEIRSLNLRFRRKDAATDVLSFPSGATPASEDYLGDVVISVEAASRGAAEAGWRVAEELQFLVIHGILHLLGHDHERDRGEMNRLQNRIARRILGRDVPEARLGTPAPRERTPRRRTRPSP
jgi:probable rRNA maturation factor